MSTAADVLPLAAHAIAQQQDSRSVYDGVFICVCLWTRGLHVERTGGRGTQAGIG